MATLSDHQDKYQHIELKREDGILQMALHSGGEEVLVGQPCDWAGDRQFFRNLWSNNYEYR